ncbi:MAG: YlxR family protein [Atribacterota bacterium]|nr:YlxR family protein [Atribacterota bacterium]
MKQLKKIPHRTCVGCLEKKPKKYLIRIIRTPDNKIELDETGKKSGRGAYICYNIECFKKAISGKKLFKALEIEISPDVLNQLAEKLELEKNKNNDN